MFSTNFGLLVENATTQNPQAETYQPGFWQPVARVKLDQPITIKLMNKTGFAVDYALTDVKMEPAMIAPQATATLENIEPSVYIVVYPDSNIPNSSRIYLKYEVEVTKDNVVKVTIKQIEDGNKSHRTLNLQETGAIYLY